MAIIIKRAKIPMQLFDEFKAYILYLKFIHN